MLIKRNDAVPLPVEQRCVVKLHREDEGVVLRFQLVIDDESIDRTSCTSLYHKSQARVKGFVSQLYRSFLGIRSQRPTLDRLW